MVLIPLAETVMVILRPSEGTQYRLVWTFGSQRREVRLCEWETDLLKLGLVPRIWQRLLILFPSGCAHLGHVDRSLD